MLVTFVLLFVRGRSCAIELRGKSARANVEGDNGGFLAMILGRVLGREGFTCVGYVKGIRRTRMEILYVRNRSIVPIKPLLLSHTILLPWLTVGMLNPFSCDWVRIKEGECTHYSPVFRILGSKRKSWGLRKLVIIVSAEDEDGVEYREYRLRR